MHLILSLLALAAMVLALLVIPLGLPGVWIMVGVFLVGALLGAVGWAPWVAVLIVAGFAELAEFGLLKALGSRYGGSPRAFWGAIIGGFVGLFVGMPIPLIGSVLAGFVGSFLGAAVVTFAETTSAERAGKVGWGVLLARVGSVVMKVGVGVAVLAVAVWELLLT